MPRLSVRSLTSEAEPDPPYRGLPHSGVKAPPRRQDPNIRRRVDAGGHHQEWQRRGRKVLLVFSDPQCGPCDMVAPDLVRFHRKHGNNGLAVLMVGRGDREENKKKAMQHGILFPVVLQEKWKLSRQYGIFATPVAFLIGQDGTIMRNVAQGTDEILKLARESLATA